jgi:hypothetical protein
MSVISSVRCRRPVDGSAPELIRQWTLTNRAQRGGFSGVSRQTGSAEAIRSRRLGIAAHSRPIPKALNVSTRIGLAAITV